METKAGTDGLKKLGIHTYDEILAKIGRRLKEIKVSVPKKHRKYDVLKAAYLKKLEVTYNILASEIDKLISALETLSKLPQFYQELFKARTGFYPAQYMRFYIKKKKILNTIYKECIAPLKLAKGKYDIRIKYRSCLGRMLSVLKRHKRKLLAIKEAIYEISRMPTIDENDLKIIVAGMPQVGKSTLVSRLSTAKPEIAPYPFTTKTIIVGHRIISPAKRIAFIDTPGLLDRPIEEKNEIEVKAILALKYLADKILFLIDPSSSAYYSLYEQINVLKSVINLINAPTIICLNKIDITATEELKNAKRIIGRFLETINRKTCVLEISAQKGIGIDKLLDTITGDP